MTTTHHFLCRALRKLAVLVATGVLVTTACTADGDTSARQSTTSTTAPTEAPQAPFASLREVPLLTGAPYAGPAWPSSLDDVLISPYVNEALATPGLREQLTTEGFAVVPGDYRLFEQPYGESAYEDGTPMFVSTDVAYHLTHLAFSKVLRTAEASALLPALERFLTDLHATTAAQADDLADGPLADAADRAHQLVQVAANLGGVDVGAIGPLARREIALARSATELTASPILGSEACNPAVSPDGCIDYTLFAPRGHYTRSADLERYFLAMSALGLLGAELDQPAPLRAQLLVARSITSTPALEQAWSQLYEPTAFLMGAADDYTPLELAAAASQVAPGWLRDPGLFADDAKLDQIADRLQSARPVLIDPEAASVRTMGTRFTIDAFALDQLAWPNVGTTERRRADSVSALDVAASMGSPLAEQLQRESGQFEYRNYERQLRSNQQLFARRALSAWGATVYDAWLWAVQPAWSRKGEQHPPFMRSDAWEAKSLQTGMGSYTELKHDTILYAKQAFAAEGSVPERLFEPRHWVEPDPVAFARLHVVIDLLAEGLSSRSLLTDESTALLAELGEMMGRLERLASDELAGRSITADDNEWVRGIGSTIEAFWLRSSDVDPDTLEPGSTDEDAALIADIFSTTETALQLATGRIDVIYVVVPNDEGRFQVARGGVYSFYEFRQPAAERLTDEEWRQRLDDGDIPERPAWQQAFLVAS